MKQPALILTAIVAALVVLLGAAGLIGWLQPRWHHAESTVLLHASRDSVWAVLANMEHSPQWRHDVTGVRRLADRNGHPVWEQQSPEGAWALELTEIVPPARIVAAVPDTTHGFGGTWTYSLEAVSGGTRVTIAEDGFVDPPLFRFLARFVFGFDTAQRRTLLDLGTRMGETVVPERVRP